ncbi:MAG: hypothetical protein AVDCRST_MAG13-607, partial [uncultured Solirubrobacteraceae bacterium]
ALGRRPGRGIRPGRAPDGRRDLRRRARRLRRRGRPGPRPRPGLAVAGPPVAAAHGGGPRPRLAGHLGDRRGRRARLRRAGAQRRDGVRAAHPRAPAAGAPV